MRKSWGKGIGDQSYKGKKSGYWTNRRFDLKNYEKDGGQTNRRLDRKKKKNKKTKKKNKKFLAPK